MLKWVLIIVGVILVGLLGTCFWGYKQLTGGGGTAEVTLASTPERAWAWLNTGDSVAALADSVTTVTWTGTGAFAVGDTIRMRSVAAAGAAQSNFEWIVTRVDSPTVRVLSAFQDTLRAPVLERIDSLVPVGDSLRISSTFTLPLFGAENRPDSMGKLGGAILSGTGKMMQGAMRLTTQLELERLKARLERP
jgi:hypothetical protein